MLGTSCGTLGGRALLAHTYDGTNGWEPHKHPDVLFIFNDNLHGHGRGGNASVRGARNALGLPTGEYIDGQPRGFRRLDARVRRELSGFVARLRHKLSGFAFSSVVYSGTCDALAVNTFDVAMTVRRAAVAAIRAGMR